MICRLRAFSLILALILLCACAPGVSEGASEGYIQDEFRGIWVATTLNLDYPSRPGLSEEELRGEAEALLDAARDMGMNAVILQVRPCGDAIYPSWLYPWSEYISGEQGMYPWPGADILEMWVQMAHERGMELHAWINPFRVTQGGNVEDLYIENPAVNRPEWCVEYKGDLYMNPGIPQVREYIIVGVSEILRQYDVDGIHFDDYFYPGPDFDDHETFEEYGGEFSSIEDWRRENVNTLVREVDELVDRIRPEARFGISPFAIWQNKDSSSRGSDTRGLESYSHHYADSLEWVENGWVDYIAPQIYWSIGYEPADYAKVLSWWVDAVKDTDVDLYIGHAGYRSLEAEEGSVWHGSAEIERQIRLNRRYDPVKGSIHFRIGMYVENPALVSALKQLYIQQ